MHTLLVLDVMSTATKTRQFEATNRKNLNIFIHAKAKEVKIVIIDGLTILNKYLINQILNEPNKKPHTRSLRT